MTPTLDQTFGGKLVDQTNIFARRFGSAVLGARGIQLAVFADTIIASLLPTG